MFDNLTITDYHVYRGGRLPAMTAQAYQYVLAANGVFVQTQNRHWQVIAPLSRCDIRGLSPLRPTVACRHGKLPGSLLKALLANAREAKDASGGLVEALYRVNWQQGQWQIIKPAQAASAARAQSAQPAGGACVLELHTHAQGHAFFSPTDNADELGLALYGVFGRLQQPTIECCLRIGVYGYFHRVPLSEIVTNVPAMIEDVGNKWSQPHVYTSTSKTL